MENKINNLSSQIKKQLIDLCEKTLSYAQTKEFPDATKDIGFSLDNLRNDIFDVVVCGEVKKGKSSFINAIIGERILPVDTKVATSQAFRIVNSNKQAFYLVFTDGTKQEVEREDLENYGSQAKIDKNGEPITFGKIVDYMEVHTPIPFLPQSVVLVDTPGLGAIYANHATVTKRHLAKASAVIFILDPTNPITEPDISFLNEVTGITQNVLLVMTKQDNYDEEYINTQINRDVEILVEKGFKEKISANEIKILPMSSTLLYDVKNADLEADEQKIFYEASFFDNVKTELLKMLQMTIGLSKSSTAYNALNQYNSRVMTAVAESEEVLKSPNSAQQLLTRKQQIKASFQATWGPNGNEQKALIKSVNNIITAFSTKATALFNPGTDLYNKLLNEIDSLVDYQATKNYAELFPKRMMTEYMQAWQGLNEECAGKINQTMSKFQKEMTDDVSTQMQRGMSNAITLPSYNLPKYGAMDYFNFTKAGWFTLFFAANIFGATIGIAALPIAALIGWFTGNKAKRDRMKSELRNYLNTNLSTLRNQILTNPMDAKDALSKSLFETTKEKHIQTAQTVLKQIYDEQLAVTEQEVERLNDQITTINKERHQIELQLKTIKEKWNPIYNQLRAIRQQLSSLEAILMANSTSVQ